jgi:ankyrin repeat protein
MKKLLFILALLVAGGVTAQDLSREMTMALKNNDISAANALITDANKDDCLTVGRHSSTLLQLSLQMGSSEMVSHLIEERNVDVNKACGEYTPLMWAAKSSTPEMVSLLLQAGADKTIQIGNKDAMHYANYYNRTEIIALLNSN